jgi:hypothetical protein
MSMPKHPRRGYDPRGPRRPKAAAGSVLPAPPDGSGATCVLIAAPTYSGLHPDYVASLLDTCHCLAEAGVPCAWTHRTSSLVPRGRNQLAALFGASPACSHLLFVDSDMGWRPPDVLRLLAADKDVVAGVGATRAGGPDAVLACRPFPDSPAPCPRTGLVQVEAAGAAFMLIRRRVFARLAAAFPDERITDAPGLPPAEAAHMHNFFPLLVEDGTFVGEDFAFCRRWRMTGGEVWVDATIRLRHHGSLVYESDPVQAFGPAGRHEEAAA